jgi:hypothetical protein
MVVRVVVIVVVAVDVSVVGVEIESLFVMLLLARSRSLYARISKYITGKDRHSVRAQTVSYCFEAYYTGYRLKYYVFARILALCQPINLTNPIRQLYSSGYSAYSCLIGLVVLIGRHSAMNLSKSLIVSNKTIVITAHLCSETTVFAKNPTFRQA